MNDKRKLTVVDASAILFNIIVGSGIFYLGTLALMYVGMKPGWALICWIIGGFVSILGGFTQAELGTSITEPGGIPVWLNRAFHPFFGYAQNVVTIFVASPAATASFALAFMTAYKTQFGLSDLGVKIGAIALIIIVGLLNLRDAKSNANTAKLTTVLKFIPLLLILGGGLFFGGVKPDLSLVADEMGNGITITMIALGVNATLWAYTGWNCVIPLSNEMKDPAKDIPKSIILSIVMVTVLYALFNFAIYRVLPIETITTMVANGDLYTGTAAASELFSFGGLLVTLCILVSVFGSFNSSVLSTTRQQAVIATSGRFPEVFGKTNKNNIPLGPICTQVGLGILFVVFSGLQGLTVLSVFINNLTNVLCVIAVPIMRKREPNLERPYKVPMYWFTIIVYTLINVALLVSAVISDPSTVLFGGIGIGLAALLWIIFGALNKKKVNN